MIEVQPSMFFAQGWLFYKYVWIELIIIWIIKFAILGELMSKWVTRVRAPPWPYTFISSLFCFVFT